MFYKRELPPLAWNAPHACSACWLTSARQQLLTRCAARCRLRVFSLPMSHEWREHRRRGEDRRRQDRHVSVTWRVFEGGAPKRKACRGLRRYNSSHVGPLASSGRRFSRPPLSQLGIASGWRREGGQRRRRRQDRDLRGRSRLLTIHGDRRMLLFRKRARQRQLRVRRRDCVGGGCRLLIAISSCGRGRVPLRLEMVA